MNPVQKAPRRHFRSLFLSCKDIRVGHAETVEKILKWLDPSTISGKRVCDAGCGTGNLSIPLASRGADVHGSDISSAMVGEAF